VFAFQKLRAFPFETEMTQHPISGCGHGVMFQNNKGSAPSGQNFYFSNGNGNGFFIIRH